MEPETDPFLSPTKAATRWTAQLRVWLDASARAAGFDATGVAEAHAQPEEPGDNRFAKWIAAGYAGEMEWLKRRDESGALIRSAIQTALPWARSVIVCAINYNAEAPRSIDPAPTTTGWIGRYAWTGSQSAAGILPTDYHDDLLARLRTLESGLHERASCQTRCYVDTGPIVEREAAVEAGIGWVGKNTCLIREGLGSWMLLGVIATSLPIETPESPNQPTLVPDRCGSCTRCLDACPTGALIAPHQMDASLCIAYLTIEKKGSVPEPLREQIGRQVFGCDICQDVCPWNRRAPIAVNSGLATRQELVNPDLAWLAALDGKGFRAAFKGSPLERTGKNRLHRNVAIAMGNSGESAFIPQLETWATENNEVLAETASWALQRLRPILLDDSSVATLPGGPNADPPLLAFEQGNANQFER